MNHVRTMQAASCPTLRAIMADTQPPAERLHTAARQLDAALDAGEFSRLASDRLVSLRALVWMMDEVVTQMHDDAMARVPMRPVRWWRRWL